MIENQEVKYVGNGFIGFDESDTTMIYLSQTSYIDVNVLYKGEHMVVSPWDIEED